MAKIRLSLQIPAPGGRYYNAGVLGHIGNGGYGWSSTISGPNGMNLNFGATWLNPSNAYNHAYGLQLRCLSE